MRLYLLFVTVFISIFYNNYAQEKGYKETLAYLNMKLKGQCTFSCSVNILKIEFYEKDQLRHIDEVDLRDLDTNKIEVNYEEKSIKISCADDYEDCITRRLLIEKSKRQFNRLIFYLDVNDKSFRGIERALLNLIRLAQIFNYSNSEPFE
ncbi:MAG: hypothetical protein HY738_16020 [Bacteroidia bacterium]|nr:hypothetical protein [Bacteroidia bacterium]